MSTNPFDARSLLVGACAGAAVAAVAVLYSPSLTPEPADQPSAKEEECCAEQQASACSRRCAGKASWQSQDNARRQTLAWKQSSVAPLSIPNLLG